MQLSQTYAWIYKHGQRRRIQHAILIVSALWLIYHRVRAKMLVLLPKTLKKLLPYAKLYVSLFKFHRNVFPVVLLIMIQQWFWWFGLLSNTPLVVQSRFNLTSICRKSKHMYTFNCIVINIHPWCACLIWIYWPPTGIFSDNCCYDWSLATPYGVRQLLYTRKRLDACVSIWNWYTSFICRKLGVSRWNGCDITHVIWIVIWPPILFFCLLFQISNPGVWRNESVIFP